MNEQQFALLMEKLGELQSCLEMIDSRLYTLEQCVWQSQSGQISQLKVVVEK